MTDDEPREKQPITPTGAQDPTGTGAAVRELVGPPSPWRTSNRLGWVAAVALLTVAGVTGVVLASGASSSGSAVPPSGAAATVNTREQAVPVPAPIPVTEIELAALPQATTYGTVPDAPQDPAPGAVPSGRLVRPNATVPVYAAPGGKPIAALPALQLVSDTAVPIVAEQPGWAQVLLPVRPNGSTGWVHLDDPRIVLSRTPYRIVVERAVFVLTLFAGDRPVGQWNVGVGRPDAVTPAGRTFLLASVRETAEPRFSDIVLPLGFHSATFETYGGGPGVVGIHGWPTADVFGVPSSDGCIRVPSDALQTISSTAHVGAAVLIK